VLKPNPPGNPITLTKEIMERVLENVSKVIIQNQVAHLSKVPKSTLSDWLIRGTKDSEMGRDTIFAQLSDRFREEQAKVAAQTVTQLRGCPKNYGALTFLLEKCFKDDFEAKSESHKQLEDYVLNFIKPRMGKGDLADGISEAKEEGR
jgi:hypothetical protein